MVDFFATWCSPCKMLAPTIEEIANETTITVAKCDIDESEDLAREYHVMSVPTVVIFKDGAEVQRFVGVREKDELINALRNA